MIKNNVIKCFFINIS